MLANMWLCAVEGGYVAMSSSAARKARIGEGRRRRGSIRINIAALKTFRLSTSQKSRFAAVGATPSARRLATSPISRWRGDTGEDIAGSG